MHRALDHAMRPAGRWSGHGFKKIGWSHMNHTVGHCDSGGGLF